MRPVVLWVTKALWTSILKGIRLLPNSGYNRCAQQTLRQLFSGYTATGSFVVTPEELEAGPAAAESAGDSRRRRTQKCRRGGEDGQERVLVNLYFFRDPV